MVPTPTKCVEIFVECDRAIRDGDLIKRAGRKDKEFHFQDWFAGRLAGCGIAYDAPGRNIYPDFTVVTPPEGYEVKGLAFPGRTANYDSNSQVPCGQHNSRTIFYVFGRYPKDPETDEYPVIDLVICHGDFLNADHDYSHKNKNVRGFGSYGDIMIRDRKMYVVPTPFALTDGTTGQRTLILPRGFQASAELSEVAHLERVEANKLVVGYSFDLTTNTLTPDYADNPGAGMVHHFTAYRVGTSKGPMVRMKTVDVQRDVGDDDEA